VEAVRRAAPVVPAELLAFARGAKVVEVGVGSDFSTALAFAAAGAQPMIVTDVRDVVLRAPFPLTAAMDDIFHPTLALYVGSALLYGVRLPEDLQISAVAVAEAVGARFALRPLKSEVAAGLEGSSLRALSGGWRIREPRMRAGRA
jgi:uncharacterized UPF0146 family protein